MPRPREFKNPYKQQLFASDTLDVFEDEDYPGGEPYLCFVVKAGPDRCACRRPFPEAIRRTSVDPSEGIDLARRILEWQAHRASQRAERERVRRKVDAERARLRALDEFSERLKRESGG